MQIMAYRLLARNQPLSQQITSGIQSNRKLSCLSNQVLMVNFSQAKLRKQIHQQHLDSQPHRQPQPQLLARPRSKHSVYFVTIILHEF